MRKRVSEIIAASLLCACLALAGTAALAVAGLLGDGPTAQAQESGGEGQQAGADAGGGGGEAEDEVEGQDDLTLYCTPEEATVPQGSLQTINCDIENDTGYNVSWRVSTTGDVVFISRSLGRPNFHGLRKATVQVRVDGDGSVTIYAQDHETNDSQTISYTATPPTPTTPAPVDKKPTFGSTSVSNQSWTRNSRISTLTLPAASDGDAPLTYSLSPSLPSGVTRSGRSVTGTPTATKSRTQYTWTVTDNDGDKARLTFYVTVALEPPTITISRNQSRIDEGETASFTLRASHAPLSSISVKISVTESGSFISGTKPTSVSISAGSTSKSFSIRTSNDDVYESNGSIAARVRSGAGYTVGSPSSASITVRSEDPRPTPRPTPEPVDNAPTFGSSSIGNKTWKQNTRISSFTLPRATGGDGTIRYSLSPAFPAGVSRTGRSVSGTPSGTMARTKYTWKATDSDRTDPDSATLTFYITVNADLAPAFGTTTTISDKTWTHNKAITNFTLPRATGGDGTLTYSLSRSGQSSGASALPAGVSRSAHSVSGTPSALLANTTFTWTATDSDGDKASLTFKIKVLPQVSIARKKAEVAEGQRAEFILTASAAPLANLAVTVRVTQSGTFISGTAPVSATISAGQTTATLSVPTTKDSVDEADGSVRAEVRTGTGYAVGSAASASVSVRDTPQISIAAGTSPVTEGANATFTITAAGAPLSSIVIPVSVTQSGAFIKGTAPTRVTIAANGTTATLTVATENDATDEQNGSITATLSGNAASPYVVVSGSSSASVTVNDNDVKLATPTDLTVTPLPERKARLSWGAVPNASAGYQVEITSGSSSKVFSARQPSYEIALDSILNGKGLAHASAYQFKVKAIYDLGGPPMNTDDDTSDPYVDGDYSSTVELRDTPIISINGDSSGRTDGKGQAVVNWRAVPGATSYTLRWRKLPEHIYFGIQVPHDSQAWRINPATSDSDWSTTRNITTTNRTVTDLDIGEIYAFQIAYERSGVKGFSARESYAWPATGFPFLRVATFPFNGHWPNKEYQYSICADTFPSNKRAQWQTLIESAFEQWESSTNDLIQIRRSLDCVVDESPASMLESMRNNVNEVFMHNKTAVERFHPYTAYLPEAYIFTKCLEPEACAIRQYHTGKWSSPSASTQFINGDIDVVINMEKVDRYSLIRPAGTQLNTCGGRGGIRLHYLYELMVHEAGHAIGLIGALPENPPPYFRFGYALDHPPLTTESVMAYDSNNPIYGYKCSPYPMDIMAVYALYQTVN